MNSSDGKTGSVRVSTIAEGLETLDYEDEIVLYDTGPLARQADGLPILEAHGYERGRRYTGGLEKGKVPGTRWRRTHRITERRYLHLPLTNNRSDGERGGELEVVLHPELRSIAGWSWRG